MKKAGSFIDQIFEDLEMSGDTQQGMVSLFSSWERIAGTDIASHTTIRDVEGSTLVIEVDHPGWAQMVSLKKTILLNGIKMEYPELGITRIRIVVT